MAGLSECKREADAVDCTAVILTVANLEAGVHHYTLLQQATIVCASLMIHGYLFHSAMQTI